MLELKTYKYTGQYLITHLKLLYPTGMIASSNTSGDLTNIRANDVQIQYRTSNLVLVCLSSLFITNLTLLYLTGVITSRNTNRDFGHSHSTNIWEKVGIFQVQTAKAHPPLPLPINLPPALCTQQNNSNTQW